MAANIRGHTALLLLVQRIPKKLSWKEGEKKKKAGLFGVSLLPIPLTLDFVPF
jgi:hypothetical protein